VNRFLIYVSQISTAVVYGERSLIVSLLSAAARDAAVTDSQYIYLLRLVK